MVMLLFCLSLYFLQFSFSDRAGQHPAACHDDAGRMSPELVPEQILDVLDAMHEALIQLPDPLFVNHDGGAQ